MSKLVFRNLKLLATLPKLIKNVANVSSYYPQYPMMEPTETSVEPQRKLDESPMLPDMAVTTGVPHEHIHTRRVRISKPSKNVMQSGTNYMNKWKIEFETRERYENWLIGWTSSRDPLSNMSVTFTNKEDAIAFCEKNNWYWFVEEQPERKLRKKSYGDNFAWNKRTRLGNK